MENRGVIIICVIGVSFLYFCNVKGACNKAPFYHVLSGLAGFYILSWVFGWARFYDTSYRCVVGRNGRFVGAGGVDWNEINSCGGRSGALNASYDRDVNGLSLLWLVCARPTLRVQPFPQSIMSSCLEAERSCSSVGPGDKISILLANSSSQRLARNVARGSGLDSVSVRKKKCTGESACRSLRR
jgi:hypothetical protein